MMTQESIAISAAYSMWFGTSGDGLTPKHVGRMKYNKSESLFLFLTFSAFDEVVRISDSS
jgi:hypothetical protein